MNPLASLRLLALLVWTVECSFYFSYSHHGEDWIQGECASRDRQSPIDFPYVSAPWQCTPPVFEYLKHLLGKEYFIKLGFAKLSGEDIPEVPVADEDALAGAPAGAESAAASPAAASASLLEMSRVEQPAAAPAPVMAVPPTPPPFIVPQCGPLGAFFFRYDAAEKPLTIQNNGHTISTDLKGHGLGSINWEGFNFDVLSVNFHVRSEHTFRGKSYPLELHVVHREPETDHILVVAIPFDVPGNGDAASSLIQRKKRRGCNGLRGRPDLANDPCMPLDPVDSKELDEMDRKLVAKAANLSPEDKKTIASVAVDGPKQPKPTDPGFCDALENLLSDHLPADGESATVPLRRGPVDLISPLLSGPADCGRSAKKDPKEPFFPQAFFQYRGSLTAPPCSEQVTWLVRKEPLFASRTQVEQLRVAIMEANSNSENARSVMPLMGRHILYRLAIQGDPPPPPPTVHDPATPPKERSVEFRGVNAGQDAVIKALEASRGRDMLAASVAAAQQNFAGAGASVDSAMAAAMQGVAAAAPPMMTSPIPTANPERVLSRIVDAVAEQMDGAEKAAAMAAAGVR